MEKRIIKFRAYIPRFKEMVEPCYVEIFSDGSYLVGRPGEGSNTIPDKNDDIVLMQFTGLLENGFEEMNKEIYDGDIIEFINGERLSVEWNDDTCQWQYSDGSPINSGDMYATHKIIIGNIYEHPHLLTPNT